MSVLRRHGPEPVVDILEQLEVGRRRPTEVADYLSRTEVGRFLLGEDQSSYEARGRPAEEAAGQLHMVASEFGYTSGKDKQLNAALLKGVMDLANARALEVAWHESEKATIPGGRVIPDVSLEIDGHIYCLEPTWRSGSFVESGNKATIAAYIMKKLKKYAEELGWVS